MLWPKQLAFIAQESQYKTGWQAFAVERLAKPLHILPQFEQVEHSDKLEAQVDEEEFTPREEPCRRCQRRFLKYWGTYQYVL